jgi:hypothetical protein
MNQPTSIHAGKDLITRNNEAEVRLIEGQADIAAAKARFWRQLASITGLAYLALLVTLIACALVFLLELTPWY